MKRIVTMIVGTALIVVFGILNSPFLLYRYITRKRQGRAFFDEKDLADELEGLEGRE